MRRRRIAPLLAALASLAAPAAASDGPSASSPPGLTVVDGVVREVDRAGHTLTVEANGAPVILVLDRNTLVFLPSGLATVLALRPGELVRAGRSERGVAFWVQVVSSPSP